MLALVCTAVFVVAAAFAVVAILVTMQGRKAQIAALLAEYRSLRRDREFLVQVTCHAAAPTNTTPGIRVVRRIRRSSRAMSEASSAKQALRAAA